VGCPLLSGAIRDGRFFAIFGGMAHTQTKRWVDVVLVVIAVLATGLAWSGISLKNLLATFLH
jgi:hypothetical protein